MEELKKPLSYEEQVSNLILQHNITIQDKTEAIHILKSVGYYRLSAYGIGLKNPDSEAYIDGTSINTLYRLYQFDSKFKNILIYTIEQIEIQLRSQISNYLALKYGAEAHINKENFSDQSDAEGKSIHELILENFTRECDRRRKVPFVRHHLEKYEGHFPIWVAVELFTFGNLTSLYAIMKKEDRDAISKMYQTESTYLKSWLLSLVEVRNICAHYGRLYNMPLKQIPHLYSENKKYLNSKRNKIFPTILTLKRMLNKNQFWCSFYEEMKCLIDSYSDVVNLSFMGFPEEWQDVLSR